MATATRTERDIVLHYTNQWFTHSEWSIERFAHELLAPALVGAKMLERELEQTDGETWAKERKAWAIRVGRIFNGTSPFPLEWKMVWIGVLPSEYAAQVRRDCLELFGVLDINLPRTAPTAPSATPSNLARVFKEFSEFVASATPAHDGCYSTRDNPAEVDVMLQEGFDVIGAVMTELLALAAGTGHSVPMLQMLMAGSRQPKVDADE